MKNRFVLDHLLLLVYIAWNIQATLARYAHHHHRVTNGDCTRCPPGFGVDRHCNQKQDTACGACAPDHYSSHHSAQRPCYPCSKCGVGLYVAHKCTASRDTVCDSCHTYKGPHNVDFYERCVRPRPILTNSQADAKGSAAISVTPPSVIAASSLAVLSVFLLVTCFLLSKRCTKGKHRYAYEIVSTKEAVML